MEGQHFIIFAQNHDQIGNRRQGDRLGQLLAFAQLKLAAAAVLLSPFLPLIFMGEEYDDPAPFQYFVSHGDPELIEAVRKGRIAEFDCFDDPSKTPDPQSEATFQRSKLDWNLRRSGRHQLLWNFYRELLRWRREIPALAKLDMETVEVEARPGSVFLRRWNGPSQAFAIFHFDSDPKETDAAVPRGMWRKVLDSSDSAWGDGTSRLPDDLDSSGEVRLALAPCSVALFVRDVEAE